MSQAGIINVAGSSGIVDSVTGTNGVTASPTTGNVVVSGVNATTSSVGVASFNPANFTVSGAGEVSLSGTGMPWSFEAVSFNALSNNGYFVTAVATATLPASPSQGDIIRFVIDTTSTVTIQANTGQAIRLGAAISASAGTAATNAQQSTLDLVYGSSTTTWYACGGVIGTWTLT